MTPEEILLKKEREISNYLLSCTNPFDLNSILIFLGMKQQYNLVISLLREIGHYKND